MLHVVGIFASLMPPPTRIQHRVGAAALMSAASHSSWPLITSRSNAKLKLIKKLHARRHREKTGQVLLEGRRLVLDAFQAGLQPDFVVVDDEAIAAESDQMRNALMAASCEVLRAPSEVVNYLSDTQTPQGVLAVFSQPALDLPPAPRLVLVCDAVSDPGNMGTLLRSATGAGADAALLGPGCCDAWGLKALRSGMGAQMRLPLRS